MNENTNGKYCFRFLFLLVINLIKCHNTSKSVMGWIDDCSQDGVCGVGHHLPFAQINFKLKKKILLCFHVMNSPI